MVDFDESLQDGATLLLYRRRSLCLWPFQPERLMKRLGGPGMLKFLQLKVDAQQDMVLVKPKAMVLRALWDEPVTLRLTSEERLWTPPLPEAEEV